MTLTPAERVRMLESDSIWIFLSRCLVFDEFNRRVGDIVDLTHNITIDYDRNAKIHKSCTLETHAELEWAKHQILPYVTLYGDGLTEELPVGRFMLTAPDPDATMTPAKFNVRGFDTIYALDQLLSQMVSWPATQPVLLAARQLLQEQQLTTDKIDNTRAGDLMTEARAWPITENITKLDIVNTLMEMIAYFNVYADDEGFVRAGPIITPRTRTLAWTYDADSRRSIVFNQGRKVSDDWTDTPNQWLAWSTDQIREVPPEIGDGLFEYTNWTEGPASVEARGGLVVPKNVPLEGVENADLEKNALVVIEQDMMSGRTLTFDSVLNPYHSHIAAFEYIDSALGVAGPWLHDSWSMDVQARRMKHSAKPLVGGIV